MKSNKKDFLSYFKPCLIVIAIVLVISTIIGCVFKFNKGFDFVGGTELVVEFPNYTEETVNEDLKNASNEVVSILNKNGVKVNSFQILGKYSYINFVVTFKDIDDEALVAVRQEINEKFNTSASFENIDDEFDITRKTGHIDGFISSNTLLITIASVLFALVICFVYGLFRVKFAGSFTMIFGAILSACLTACFVILTRIEINTYFFVVLMLAGLTSMFMTVDFLFDVKEKSKELGRTSEELANIVANEHFNKNLVIGIFAICLSLVYGIFSVCNILHLALSALIAVAVSYALNLFVLPAFWALISKNNVNNTKVVSSAEEVTVNNEDLDAEVVEVKE